MDVVVFCPAAYRAEAADTLGPGPLFYCSWPAFEEASRQARVAVVVIEQLGSRPGAADVARLQDPNGWTSVVLATGADPDNLMLVPYARPDELVILSRLGGTLPQAVMRAATGLRTKLADAVRSSSLSTWLVEALTTALDQDPPLTSVDAWCDRVACVPATLRYHFARESLELAGVTPKDFLEAALLLFALERAPLARSWYALSRAAGLDRRRLQRAARRIVPEFRNSPAELDRGLLLGTVARWLQAGVTRS